MMARNWTCVAMALTTFACTQSYDSFDFAGGAPPSGGSVPSTGGGETGGSVPSGGGGAAPAEGGNGGTPSTGGMGGEGGAPTVAEVPCGTGGSCDLASGDACCINEGGETDGTCESSCNPGNEASLACNEPSDCSNGDSCCLVFNGGDFDTATCKSSCGGGDDVVCDPETSAPCAGQCEQVPNLPAGFKTCQ